MRSKRRDVPILQPLLRCSLAAAAFSFLGRLPPAPSTRRILPAFPNFFPLALVCAVIVRRRWPVEIGRQEGLPVRLRRRNSRTIPALRSGAARRPVERPLQRRPPAACPNALTLVPSSGDAKPAARAVVCLRPSVVAARLESGLTDDGPAGRPPLPGLEEKPR